MEDLSLMPHRIAPELKKTMLAKLKTKTQIK